MQSIPSVMENPRPAMRPLDDALAELLAYARPPGAKCMATEQVSTFDADGASHSAERAPQCDLGNDVALGNVTSLIGVCKPSEFGGERLWQWERDDLTSRLAVQGERAARALLVGRREP